MKKMLDFEKQPVLLFSPDSRYRWAIRKGFESSRYMAEDISATWKLGAITKKNLNLYGE